jgi:ribulose-5-phosphate 4-epimerase/fuculose-1-phosphate aldolase
MAMSDKLAELRRELSVANRILANEDVVDAFGHISVRHPEDSDRYLISRHRAAELVEPADILELTLDSVPVKPTDARLYSELVIHGEVYKARPDVYSVCHHHAPSVMPFCITGVALVPVMPLGATMGLKVPVWDSRDEFGDTELLITKPAEGRLMAKALGDCWMVLLARHGATVAAHSLHECVFRSIYICRNAELQMRGMAMGKLGPLSKGEIEKCAAHSLTPRTISRAWEYWARRLEKADYATGGHSPKIKPEHATRPEPAKLISSQGETGGRKR